MTRLDHVGLSVRDFEKSRDFYTAALGAVGIKLLMDLEHDGKRHAGYGGENAFFWLSDGGSGLAPVHVAFTAASRAEVEAFYSIALNMGGRDNGKPGLRPHYHPDYFGAFVLDPDGNNIEAVCHDKT